MYSWCWCCYLKSWWEFDRLLNVIYSSAWSQMAMICQKSHFDWQLVPGPVKIHCALCFNIDSSVEKWQSGHWFDTFQDVKSIPPISLIIMSSIFIIHPFRYLLYIHQLLTDSSVFTPPLTVSSSICPQLSVVDFLILCLSLMYEMQHNYYWHISAQRV